MRTVGVALCSLAVPWLTSAVEPPQAVRTVDDKGKAYATAPWDATFKVNIDGQPNKFTVRIHPDWAPEGAKRFQDIAQDGVMNDARFFRVVPDFMAQFGIPGDATVAQEWHAKTIQDDPVTQSNSRGRLTYATAGPNTRTTQMFINFKDNAGLDTQGFAPFGEVLGDGMKVVDAIQSKYQEQPDQGEIEQQGNKYLSAEFPDLSFVEKLESEFLSGGATPKSSAGSFLQRPHDL